MLADLGQVQLKRGNTETALATWSEFLACPDGVQSVRINDGLTNIAARLPSIPDSPAAAELGERIAARETEDPARWDDLFIRGVGRPVQSIRPADTDGPT
ncbi:hypothetical protein GCM10010359_50040 [Streptomyces morookaense]|nr:hypothetical protein GCM10010359_50040 [Streptomyces morookaense]